MAERTECELRPEDREAVRQDLERLLVFCENIQQSLMALAYETEKALKSWAKGLDGLKELLDKMEEQARKEGYIREDKT